MKRQDGAYMTTGEMAETIERQAEKIRRLEVDNDNLWRELSKSRLSEPSCPESYWKLPSEGA